MTDTSSPKVEVTRDNAVEVLKVPQMSYACCFTASGRLCIERYFESAP